MSKRNHLFVYLCLIQHISLIFPPALTIINSENVQVFLFIFILCYFLIIILILKDFRYKKMKQLYIYIFIYYIYIFWSILQNVLLDKNFSPLFLTSFSPLKLLKGKEYGYNVKESGEWPCRDGSYILCPIIQHHQHG